jgi:hypothetical protein
MTSCAGSSTSTASSWCTWRPNSITIISTFIHLYEAYLSIAPHFHLWRHFFELKKTGKGVVFGSVGFMLHRNMKSEYIDLTLPDNTTGWKQGWFYLDNPTPMLRERTGRVLVPGPEWTNQLASRDTEELKPLLDDLEQLKEQGLTGAAVAINFCCRLIQPLQDQAHPAFEYWGKSDPTRVAQHKVSKAEMMARAKNIFGRRICKRECPKSLGVYNPSDPVSLRPWCFKVLCKCTSWVLVLIEFLRLVFQHREGIYWCLAPLRDKDQRGYKVRDVADV